MYRVLILNKAWQPHEVVSWEDAVTRMFNGKIEVLAQYDEVLAVIGQSKLREHPELKKALKAVIGTDPERIDIKVPAVALLRKNVRHVKSGVKFARINVALRDKFCCQYCGQKFTLRELTYDHVIPRSRGGKTVWANIVMACKACNSRKADRTPQESGMVPLNPPVKPHILPMHLPAISLEDAPPEWLPFLGSAAVG